MIIRPAASGNIVNCGLALLLVITVFALTGCERDPKELRLYPREYQQMDPEAMQDIFEQNSGVRMRRVDLDPSVSPLDALTTDRADLSVVENTAPFTPGVRAVMPIYRSVLHLLARKNRAAVDPSQPLLGLTVHVANNSHAGHTFLQLAAKRQGLTASDYRLVAETGEENPDLIIYFGPINPDQSSWYREGYRLVSLDQEFAAYQHFYQQGIDFVVPQMNPLVIPPLTYQLPGNEGPLQTLSVDSLLVARKEVPERVIYQVTRVFIEQKPRFTAIAPNIFAGITESFDPLDLNFPLHAGARRFLHRDEPGLLERYAETINMLTYLVFLLLSGLVGFARWRAQRKKDRIDTFYVRVFSIRERADGEDHALLLQELDALEKEAFESLIDEKLAADESFRIFTELLSDARTMLRSA